MQRAASSEHDTENSKTEQPTATRYHARGDTVESTAPIAVMYTQLVVVKKATTSHQLEKMMCQLCYVDKKGRSTILFIEQVYNVLLVISTVPPSLHSVVNLFIPDLVHMRAGQVTRLNKHGA